MSRLLAALLAAALVVGGVSAGCNHSKRIYATCYCTAPVVTGSISVVVTGSVSVVTTNCLVCQAQPSTEPAPFDDDDKPGKGPR